MANNLSLAPSHAKTLDILLKYDQAQLLLSPFSNLGLGYLGVGFQIDFLLFIRFPPPYRYVWFGP